MAVVNDTVYIKADKNVEVTKRDVTLGDILSFECSNPAVVPKLKTIKLLKIPEKGQRRFAVSVLRVIELIHQTFPNLDVQSLGEQDFIVTYENQKTPSQFVHWLKVVCVVLITFTGSAFSIMTFNNDVDIPRLFSQIYELITGTTSKGFTIMELTYCIGLIVGILVFFNHFGKTKFSVDPTPMEVEMRLYENDIQTTLIENASRKEQEIDAGKTDYPGGNRA